MTIPRSLASSVCLSWQELPEGQTRRTQRTLLPHPPRTSQGLVWLLRLQVVFSQDLLYMCPHDSGHCGKVSSTNAAPEAK